MKTNIISFLIIMMLSTSLAFAQSMGNNSDNGKMTYAILAGVNFQNLNGKAFNGDKLSNKMLVGYHIGANLQIPIVPEFYFQPGLMVSTKGAKNTSGSFNSTTKLTYLEMPLNFVYKGMLGNSYIMVGFGPYIAYGIGGKISNSGGVFSGDTKIVYKNIVQLNDPLGVPYERAFDAGANIFVGYEMANKIFVQLNTQFGMLKVNPQDKRIINDKTSVNNTGFGISLGYRF